MNRRIILLLVSCVLLLGNAHAQTGHFFPSDLFSSSLISCLCQDRDGGIWIGTDYGLNRFDGYHFQTFLHDESDSTSLQANVVTTLFCDDDGMVWVGTNRGLDRFDYASESFIHQSFPDGLHCRVSRVFALHSGELMVGTAGFGAFVIDGDGHVSPFVAADGEVYFSRLFEDSQGRLWRSGFNDKISLYGNTSAQNFTSSVGNPQEFFERNGELLIVCQHGILTYKNGQMQKFDGDMSVTAGIDVNFSSASVNARGDIIIGSRGQGIYRLPASSPQLLERIEADASGVDPNTAKVSAALFDRTGNLWLGCHRKGLLLLPQRPLQFKCWSFESQGVRVGSTVSSVCEGDDGMTWCTVQGVGVYGFDSNGHIVARPHTPGAVEFIFRDRQGQYWLGTDDGFFSYNPLTGQSELKLTFDCDKFNDMTSDDEGRIYLSTFAQGMCIYDKNDGSFRNYTFYNGDSIRGRICNNWVMGMTVDQQGLLWLATSSGVACYAPHGDTFLSQGWESLLNGVVCFDVCELHSGSLPGGRQLDGCIAIGTEQGLYLYDRMARRAERFPGSEALANKTVSYIVQGNDGDIWCSTSEGIWQYSLADASFIGHVNGNGLTQKEYIYGVGLHTNDDVIYFGQNSGLTVFRPADVKVRRELPDPLKLTAFRAGDQYVNSRTVLNGVAVTDGQPVTGCDYFTLSYLDHTVTLAFSQFNFDNPRNLTIEYRVNGGDWIQNPKGQNEFTLGHLQPGTYRIEARGVQGENYTAEKVVVVTIRAPWYRSLAAYFVYLLLTLGLLFLVLRTYHRRANEQLNEEKMKFLINATHDIRSPLTIILSALKKLERNAAVDTIEHNSKRILNLVNQILDVRKIDKQQMHLHCQATDMVSFIQGICKMFEFSAQERTINFQFLHEGTDSLEAWVDRTQFDKVVTNLLSNAFKYSYDGGEVTVTLGSDGQQLRLQVHDKGAGLAPESLRHIFDRFYQGSNSRQMHIDGTGIGLNLCKMIVDMHHGTIEAANRTDTQGAVFTVVLPLGTAHLKPEEMDTTPAAAQPQAAPSAQQQASSRHRVLIVDDDVEIGQYISQELGRYYKFGICTNGKEGLKELLQHDYDVVVSDVMMPEMDGFTMLRMVKTNLNLSHIPVILLTSKADVANRLEGLERGADAFLAKPFDMEELHMVINNLIQSRLHLKGKYSGAQKQEDKLEKPEVKGNDEQLMERIMKAVNKNLSDSDFNVDMLTREVGISRTQLHRKMRELTGLTTSEFIRNIRLEQAARLLKEQKINVTQVAYTVGFSNLAHFSTLFKKHFGMSPSEYVSHGE